MTKHLTQREIATILRLTTPAGQPRQGDVSRAEAARTGPTYAAAALLRAVRDVVDDETWRQVVERYGGLRDGGG